MNIYGVIALCVLIIVVGHFFHLELAMQQLFERLADVPEFTEKGDNPAIFDFAVRLAYLIALVGILKLFLTGRGGHD